MKHVDYNTEYLDIHSLYIKRYRRFLEYLGLDVIVRRGAHGFYFRVTGTLKK
jgi:hypothetical protein